MFHFSWFLPCKNSHMHILCIYGYVKMLIFTGINAEEFSFTLLCSTNIYSMKYICAFFSTWRFNLCMLSIVYTRFLSVCHSFLRVQMSLHFRWLLYKSKESSSCSIQFARFYWIKCSILRLNTRENSMKNVVVFVGFFSYIWNKDRCRFYVHLTPFQRLPQMYSGCTYFGWFVVVVVVVA